LLDSTAAIRAAAARSAFDLPSAFFVAMDHGSHVELIGQGFGHGIGMCQEGAMARAQAGASSWDILSAYFQDVYLADGLAAWRLVQRLGK
jgi:stage II sporulation protein D